ncbi:hypothetical protein M2306_001093 [Myroides gitamensis]|uniref:hypothetical protein n=1 Tax=Myroides odoratus TaxID=256 RepID=UPI0021693113|nr:hypothetical protein [Myroides odoratus]MCS4238667.1 hypothetical protein [Myroides odoratus]MDH6600399.1 hypothetical protein [Myroides gitamensis]
MKNLLLVVAFMLSIGAFAQNQTYPRDPDLILCEQMPNFIPECHIRQGNVYTLPGEYVLEICLKESLPRDVIKEMIQEYICEYNKFPDYVRVLRVDYKTTPYPGGVRL